MSDNETRPEGPVTASVEKLRHELDRWLDAAVSQGERALEAVGIRESGGPWVPAIDIVETPDEVLVDIDLPGVDPQSVNITLAGNMLTLEGERTQPAEIEGMTTHTQERARGSFSRSIPIPAPVNSEDVSAEAENGVLHVRLSKSERAKARKIEINVDRKPQPTGSGA